MRVVAPGVERADDVADLWVDLAAEQRDHGSHVLAGENRAAVRETVAGHAVAGGLLVALDEADGHGGGDGDGDGNRGRESEGEGAGREYEYEGDGDGPAADLLGFVLFDRETGGFETDADRGMVRYIYVRPERRGEGVGSALLSAAEERLFADGADAVALEVLADNEPARRFYRRHGYEPHRVELESESDTHTKDR